MVMRNSMLLTSTDFFRIYIFLCSPPFTQVLHGHIFKDEIGERLFFDVRVSKHDAKTNMLVIFLRKFKRDLPMLEHVQPAALTLHLPPGRAYVQLTRYRDLHDRLNGVTHR